VPLRWPAADPHQVWQPASVENRHKLAKLFDIAVAEDSFTFERNQTRIADEARLDGFYVIRTDASEPAVAIVHSDRRTLRRWTHALVASRSKPDSIERRLIRSCRRRPYISEKWNLC